MARGLKSSGRHQRRRGGWGCIGRGQKRDRAKKGNGRRSTPSMATRWRSREERGRGWVASCGHAAWRGVGGGVQTWAVAARGQRQWVARGRGRGREREGEVVVGWDRPDGGTLWQREKEDGALWVANPEVGPTTGSEKGGMTGGLEPGKEKKKTD
jgi:hypothetical protein